jgi:hypothetical protein
MAVGYHVIRYAPEGERSTWDVVVAEGDQKTILVQIYCDSEAESERVRNELANLLDRLR